MEHNAGIYLKRLRYEIPYTTASNPATRYAAQDALIMNSMKAQSAHSDVLRNAATAESQVWGRYRLALRNYMNLLLGYPDYLK